MPKRLLVAFVLAAALTSALAGCSSIPALNPPVQAVYSSWHEAEQTTNPTPPPPPFVPHDATAIYVRTRATDGAAIITYRSASAPSGCRAGALTGSARLDANWWPVAKPPAEGALCPSGWRLYIIDGVTYGWRDPR